MSHVAVAIAIPANPFKAASESAANFGHLVFDFMYGTKQRSNFTIAFSIALGALGMAMDYGQHLAMLQSCAA